MVLGSSGSSGGERGWPWEMGSATVARVRDRNPMEIADDLGHCSWRSPYGHPLTDLSGIADHLLESAAKLPREAGLP